VVALKWTGSTGISERGDGAPFPIGSQPGWATPADRQPSGRRPPSEARPRAGRQTSSGRLTPSGGRTPPSPSRRWGAGLAPGHGRGPLQDVVLLPCGCGEDRFVVTSATQARPRGTRRPAAAASHRRRVYLWRRVIVVAAIAAFGAVAWGAGGRLVAVAPAQPSRAPVQHVYVVRPGDTIWGIAVRYSGDGDPRPLADRLEAQIGGGVLQPGEQLTVP
jgi:nucleoid-associated protein YgaU